MPYFRIDDGFPSHPKVLAIPRRDRVATVGLWALAGAWCNHHLTDGRLAKHMVEELGSAKKYADHLLRVGLWDVDGDDYVFHQFVGWQGASREEVLTKREAEAERKRKWREAKAAKRAEPGPDVPDLSRRDNPRTDNGTTASVRPSSAPRPLLPCPTPPSPSHPVVPYGDYEDGSTWGETVTGVDAHADDAPPPGAIPGQCLRHAHETDPPPCVPCQRAREALERDTDTRLSWPPWCRDAGCNPTTRQRWDEDRDLAYRCPICHPDPHREIA